MMEEGAGHGVVCIIVLRKGGFVDVADKEAAMRHGGGRSSCPFYPDPFYPLVVLYPGSFAKC